MKRILVLLIPLLLLSGCQSNPTAEEEKSAKSAKLHYQLGIDALRKGQLPKAFQELMKSDSVQPNQPKVLDALAFAWRVRGNLKKSEALYKKALRHGAGASTHTNYGGLLVEMGRYKDAEKQLRKALEDPRYGNQYIAFVNLGDALRGQKRYEDAINTYRQAGRMQPSADAPRLREAAIYIEQGRFNYAQALYTTMLHERPDNRPVLEAALQLLEKRGDYATAKELVRNFLEHTRSDLDRGWASDELIRLEKRQ